MIDLTNKNVDELINKHAQLLQGLRKENIPQMAYILDIAIPHIQTNHLPLKPEWKAWVFMVLKKLQEKNKLKVDKDVFKYIDDFVKFSNENYNNYLTEIVISTSDYDRDYGFMLKYLKSIGF